MEEIQSRQLPKELHETYRLADGLARKVGALGDLHDEGRDAELREEATKDPHDFLAARGIDVPEGLRVSFLDFPPPRMPGPEFESFTIRQFDCRTYWRWTTDDDGNRTIEEVQICWGWEIVPSRLPGGPIG